MSFADSMECRQETDFAHAAAVATEITARAKYAKPVAYSGKLAALSLRKTRQGKAYALFRVSCGPSSHVGFAFTKAVIEALETIGVGGMIEVTGKIEEVMVIQPSGAPKIKKTYRAHKVMNRAV